MKRSLLSLVVALAACDGDVVQPDAAPPIDAAPTDAAGSTALDLTGGGRMTGGTLVVDVQIGGPIARTPASGGTVTLQPSTPIKP